MCDLRTEAPPVSPLSQRCAGDRQNHCTSWSGAPDRWMGGSCRHCLHYMFNDMEASLVSHSHLRETRCGMLVPLPMVVKIRGLKSPGYRDQVSAVSQRTVARETDARGILVDFGCLGGCVLEYTLCPCRSVTVEKSLLLELLKSWWNIWQRGDGCVPLAGTVGSQFTAAG